MSNFQQFFEREKKYAQEYILFNYLDFDFLALDDPLKYVQSALKKISSYLDRRTKSTSDPTPSMSS